MTYYPVWDRVYKCAYCNRAVRLSEPEGMCDSYYNVVHKQCLKRIWDANHQAELHNTERRPASCCGGTGCNSCEPQGRG